MTRTDEATPLLAGSTASRRSYVDGHVDGATDVSVRDAPDGPVTSPFDWSPGFKWGIVALLAYSAFTVTFGCISLAPLATRIVSDLDGAGPPGGSAAVILVTIWEVGEAAGPLLIAPLSELCGRRPVFLLAQAAFVCATVLGAAAPSSALLVASRALTGAAVAANVLNPAVVGDMFAPAQRGSAMSCIMFAPLIASSLGPAFSSLVDAALGWRAVLWASALLATLSQLMFLACFRETYPVALASKKAEKRSTGLGTAILRPFVVFFGSGVLMVLSAYGALVFSYFYIVATTMPAILEDVYSFEPGTTGPAFLANGFGTLIGVTICRLSLDRIYVRLAAASPDGAGLPEYRLPLTIAGILTLPGGVALYGWCAEHHLPLPLFLFSVVWIRVSMMLAFVPIMPYVVDACGIYAASALTGVIVTRCLTGAFLPLLTAVMVSHLSYGWGFSALALVNVVFGLIPIGLLRYGHTWRQSSKYTQTYHLPGGFTSEDHQA